MVFKKRPEPKKRRNRLLGWTQLLNDATADYNEPSRIADTLCAAQQLGDAYNQYGKKMRVMTADVEKAFFGFNWSPALADLAIAKCGDTYVKPLTLPMGYRPSAEICQVAVELLARAALRRVKPGSCVQYTHVDNVRFAGVTAKQAMRSFHKITAECGMKITTDSPDVFLGMRQNIRTGKVACTDELIDKIAMAATRLKREGTISHHEPQHATQTHNDNHHARRQTPHEKTTMTFRDMYELFSRLIHASRVLRLPLARYYAVFKYIRRRIAQLATAAEPARVWPSVMPLLMDWCVRCKANQPTRHTTNATTYDVAIFTDASLQGWGAVIIDLQRNIAHEAQGRWKTAFLAKDINYLEMRAATLAVQHATRLEAINKRSAVLLVVDNTSVTHIATKGTTTSWKISTALRELQKSATIAAQIAVAYIRTDLNPADKLTRGAIAQAQPFQLPPALRALGALVGEGLRPIRLPIEIDEALTIWPLETMTG